MSREPDRTKGPRPPRRFPRRRDVVLCGILPFSVYLTLGVAALGLGQASTTVKPSTKQKIEKLEIQNFRGNLFREWTGDAAVEFGLNQAADLIKYLLFAATALLGFVARLLVDPILKPKEASRTSFPGLLLLINAAAGCFFSLVLGTFANGQFPPMVSNRSFSIYGSFGWLALLQQICFLLAVFWFILGIATELVKQLAALPQEADARDENASSKPVTN